MKKILMAILALMFALLPNANAATSTIYLGGYGAPYGVMNGCGGGGCWTQNTVTAGYASITTPASQGASADWGDPDSYYFCSYIGSVYTSSIDIVHSGGSVTNVVTSVASVNEAGCNENGNNTWTNTFTMPQTQMVPTDALRITQVLSGDGGTAVFVTPPLGYYGMASTTVTVSYEVDGSVGYATQNWGAFANLGGGNISGIQFITSSPSLMMMSSD